MKVVVLARGYPTEEHITNGLFEFDQAKALKKNGVDVIFAAVDLRSVRKKRKFGYEKKIKENIPIYSINIPLGRFPDKILDYFRLRSSVFIINKIIEKEGKVDLIHSHFIEYGYCSVKLKKHFDIPIVHTEHYSGLVNLSDDKKLFDKGERTYHYIDRLITVSPDLQNIIKREFNTNSVYIPNIVDTDLFKIEKEKNKNFTFITVGNLIKRKSMDLTLQAFKEVQNKYNNIQLIIVGDGPERPSLEEFVKKNNLTSSVLFTGKIDRKKISSYLNVANVFVLPSKAETFGVVYIEAMSAGLPVIGTKCGGPEHLITPDNGIIINIDNNKELVNSMIYMIEHKENYNNNIIRKNTIKKYSSKVIANEIIKNYEETLRENK